MSLGITQTNNEIKNVIKVIRFLENRGILLERTTEKNIKKKEEDSLVSFSRRRIP